MSLLLLFSPGAGSDAAAAAGAMGSASRLLLLGVGLLRGLLVVMRG